MRSPYGSTVILQNVDPCEMTAVGELIVRFMEHPDSRRPGPSGIAEMYTVEDITVRWGVWPWNRFVRKRITICLVNGVILVRGIDPHPLPAETLALAHILAAVGTKIAVAVRGAHGVNADGFARVEIETEK